MRFIVYACLALLAAARAHGDEIWTGFRGPNGSGLSDARTAPTVWSETQNIRWKTAIHDKGWSSPVLWGKQIWMTTGRADGKELFAVCVDLDTGKILHDVSLFRDPKPAYCNPFNSYASPSPAIEEGRVYVHFGVHGTACLDTATGKILWKRRDFPCYHHRGPGSSPIVYGKLLFLTFDGYDQQYVVALDKVTGETVWKKERTIEYASDDGDIKKAFATPAILALGGKAQLVSPAAEATLAYDPETGAELWRVVHGGMNEATRPVFGNGLIFLTTGHTKGIVAVRQGGSGDVTKTGIAWKSQGGGPTRPSPLFVGDLLFTVSDEGIVVCRQAQTGKQIWKDRLDGRFSSSPVYAAGYVYAADEDGKTFVFAAERAFKPVAVNQLEAGCMASPAFSSDWLILRTKTHIYCIATH
jgi:outer membrane protein assembly factor BamB